MTNFNDFVQKYEIHWPDPVCMHTKFFNYIKELILKLGDNSFEYLFDRKNFYEFVHFDKYSKNVLEIQKIISNKTLLNDMIELHSIISEKSSSHINLMYSICKSYYCNRIMDDFTKIRISESPNIKDLLIEFLTNEIEKNSFDECFTELIYNFLLKNKEASLNMIIDCNLFFDKLSLFNIKKDKFDYRYYDKLNNLSEIIKNNFDEELGNSILDRFFFDYKYYDDIKFNLYDKSYDPNYKDYDGFSGQYNMETQIVYVFWKELMDIKEAFEFKYKITL